MTDKKIMEQKNNETIMLRVLATVLKNLSKWLKEMEVHSLLN